PKITYNTLRKDSIRNSHTIQDSVTPVVNEPIEISRRRTSPPNASDQNLSAKHVNCKSITSEIDVQGLYEASQINGQTVSNQVKKVGTTSVSQSSATSQQAYTQQQNPALKLVTWANLAASDQDKWEMGGAQKTQQKSTPQQRNMRDNRSRFHYGNKSDDLRNSVILDLWDHPQQGWGIPQQKVDISEQDEGSGWDMDTSEQDGSGWD
ncbi:10522_t:CDS:1, partial [Diversispora eburnea]